MEILCFSCVNLRIYNVINRPSALYCVEHYISEATVGVRRSLIFICSFHGLMLRKRVRFDRAAEFLAACASGDTEEAELMLKDTEDYEADREEYVEIIDCTNADGITALHQVRPFFSPEA